MIYEEYAQVCLKIKELTAQKEAMSDTLIADMLDRNVKKEEHPFGSFTIAHLKKWTYPAEIVDMADELKAKKAKAESTGDATFVEEPSLRFTGINL